MKTPQNSRSTQLSVKNTQLTKKPSGKRVGAYGNTPGRVNKQAPVNKSRLKGYLTTLGAIAILMATGGVLVGGIWLGIVLMVNPNAVVWLNRFLPEWTRIPIDAISPPKTLATIEDEVRKSGLIPGETQSLNNSELLLPILGTLPNCQINCEQIVELRVYQPTESSGDEKYYQLASQLPIIGPEDDFVLSTAVSTQSGNPTVSRKLPLTKLTRFDDQGPAEGIWFNVSGHQDRGDTPMTYGEVIYYNPDQMRLSVMLDWTTPNESQPYWQQLTGDSTPEFVVNRTVGLEPQFKVYQVKPLKFAPNPIEMEEIDLAQPALYTQSYRNALILARSGLWSPAWQLLQSQKKNNGSAAAQAQMDFIQLHSHFTESQAKQSWATSSQQIFANLIDGRWADALQVFQSSETGGPVQEIATLLKADSGGLWKRVEVTLKVNPDDTNVKAWGALILTAQQGRPKAIAWLKQLQKTKSEQTQAEFDFQINELLNHLDPASAEVLPTNSHTSKIVGTAQLVKNVNPKDWLQPEDQESSVETGLNASQSPDSPNPTSPSPPLSREGAPIPKRPSRKAQPLQKEAQQVWYQVQVVAFNDGQRWQQAPFSKLTLPKVPKVEELWKYLGLDSDSQIQITVWTADGSQKSTSATVKAVSYRGGTIQLLAAGEALPVSTPATGGPPQKRLPLAYTDAALNWIDPGSITLSDLNQVQPQWVSVLLPALWRELVKNGQVKQGALPSNAVLLREMGQWSVRVVDLTGNNQPEAILTLYEDLSGALKKPDDKPPEQGTKYRHRALIFSDKGALLYSEFSQDANSALTAIADLGDGGPAALVLNNSNNYSLKRWSAQGNRFE